MKRLPLVCALLAAASYAALAGFSVPTQRALTMTAVFLAAFLLRSRSPPGHSLALALLLVLVVDPLSALSAGFWLSFAAVFVILFGVSGRLRQQGFWWRWGRVHWLIAGRQSGESTYAEPEPPPILPAIPTGHLSR